MLFVLALGPQSRLTISPSLLSCYGFDRAPPGIACDSETTAWMQGGEVCVVCPPHIFSSAPLSTSGSLAKTIETCFREVADGTTDLRSIKAIPITALSSNKMTSFLQNAVLLCNDYLL